MNFKHCFKELIPKFNQTLPNITDSRNILVLMMDYVLSNYQHLNQYEVFKKRRHLKEVLLVTIFISDFNIAIFISDFQLIIFQYFSNINLILSRATCLQFIQQHFGLIFSIYEIDTDLFPSKLKRVYYRKEIKRRSLQYDVKSVLNEHYFIVTWHDSALI